IPKGKAYMKAAAVVAGERIDAILADPVGDRDRLVEEHRLKRVVEHPGPRYERHRGENLACHLAAVAIEEGGKLARRRGSGNAGEVELGSIGAGELSCPQCGMSALRVAPYCELV